MTRQEKYPETSAFHYHNANPKNRLTGDCVARAICTALEIPYNTVVAEMAEQHCRTGYAADDKKGIELYLQSKGWVKKPQPRWMNGKKVTGYEFCREMREGRLWGDSYSGRIVAMIGGGHIVAIVEGRVWDTWNSTGGCIGNYWVKP